MNNIRPLMKRVCAYAIDIVIVTLLASSISSIKFLNKNMEEYQKTYEEYEERYTNYTNYLNLLEESYKDKVIEEEEYNKLIEISEYKEIITKKYEDKVIEEEEYNSIVSQSNKEFDSVVNNYVYRLNKQGISNSIITLICTLLYFGIVQYLLKGQTIGKKLLKLKVISITEKKLTIWTYLLRSLIVNNVLLNTISIIFLTVASKKVYNAANTVLSSIVSLLEAAIIFTVLTRSDGRGLHDLLFKTKVLSTKEELIVKEEKETTKTQKTIEAEYTEKTKPTKKQNKK